MKSLGGLLVAVLMVVLSAPALAATDDGNNVNVKVMSQNLYIGVDLNRVLAGQDPLAVLEIARSTDYPGRAAKIAETIAANKPDLVGIQEATLITVFTFVGGQKVVLQQDDYLDE